MSIRGALGNITVWMTSGGFHGKHERASGGKIYTVGDTHHQCEFIVLKLKRHIILNPGQRVGIYIHSGLQNDGGVYANKRGNQGSDEILDISTGIAYIISSIQPDGLLGRRLSSETAGSL